MSMPNKTLHRIQASTPHSWRRFSPRLPRGLSESRAVSWRRAAIFAVKLVHSVIFLSVAASILHIFYAGITNRSSRLTKIALALGESLVFAVNRFRCPLTRLAEELGAESGQVTDIFLPRWFADRIPWIFTPPLVTGILTLLWRRWRSPATRRDKRHIPANNRKHEIS